LEIKSQIAKKW